jgi:hypothetical protein
VSGLFKWGGRKAEAPSVGPTDRAAASDATASSKVLPKVFAALGHVESPVLLDLGPVIGSNISFFGEQLACKIFVEDLFAEVEAWAPRTEREGFGAALVARVRRPAASVDGIFCWDLFDYLDKPASQALAAHLVQVLRPGGVLYGFFGSSPGELTTFTRFIVDDLNTYRLRSAPAPPARRNVLVTRDINRMFDGLVVTESVLLKSNAREILFRKPS